MICSKGDISVNMPYAERESANPPGGLYLFFTAAVKLAGLSLAEKYVCMQFPLNNAWGELLCELSYTA